MIGLIQQLALRMTNTYASDMVHPAVEFVMVWTITRKIIVGLRQARNATTTRNMLIVIFDSVSFLPNRNKRRLGFSLVFGRRIMTMFVELVGGGELDGAVDVDLALKHTSISGDSTPGDCLCALCALSS